MPRLPANLGLKRTVQRYWTSIALVAVLVLFVVAVTLILSGDGSMRNSNDLAFRDYKVSVAQTV